jgi:hypothetical protein
VHLEDARSVDDVLGSLDIERTADEAVGLEAACPSSRIRPKAPE